METISALLATCAENSPIIGEFLNLRLSKQWWGWWFETASRPLWRHSNGFLNWHWTHRVESYGCRVCLVQCSSLNPKGIGEFGHCSDVIVSAMVSKSPASWVFAQPVPRRWPLRFSSQRASNAENVFIWWCYHAGSNLKNIIKYESCTYLF